MKKIVIFASGAGTNAENIVKYCQEKRIAQVVAIGTNNSNAVVIERAKMLSIPFFIFDKNELHNDVVLDILRDLSPDLIVLAGFLLKFPDHILKEFPKKVINIHPSLLPKYGGKGMYGNKVHESVFENRESYTGITIHFVNENYDEGAVIFQKSVCIDQCKSAAEIAAKISELEMEYLPIEIKKLL